MKATKRLAPAAIVALEEALTRIYWYKDKLKKFLRGVLTNPAIVDRLDWSQYKRQVVSELIVHLQRSGSAGVSELIRLCDEVCEVNDFSHLERQDDGDKKATHARQAVSALQKLHRTHSTVRDEFAAAQHRQKQAEDRLSQISTFQTSLDAIRTTFIDLLSSSDPQGRGRKLESVLYDLFKLFDLDPKASFSIQGEQIDGAFVLRETDFIVEAKWQQRPVSRKEVRAFQDKVAQKLENTLGVFISVNGFASTAINIQTDSGTRLILVDGADLNAVLEGKIDLKELLSRKKQHAARTGEAYLALDRILAG